MDRLHITQIDACGMEFSGLVGSALCAIGLHDARTSVLFSEHHWDKLVLHCKRSDCQKILGHYETIEGRYTFIEGGL